MGSSILVAPILHPFGETPEIVSKGIRYQTRQVHLPSGWWFDLKEGEWIEGGKTVTVHSHLGQVPLFIRDGSIIPYFNGPLQNADINLHQIEMHIFVKNKPAKSHYYIDNPENRQYLEGKFKTFAIQSELSGNCIKISFENPSEQLQWTPVIYGDGIEMIQIGPSKKTLKISTRRWVDENINVKFLQYARV